MTIGKKIFILSSLLLSITVFADENTYLKSLKLYESKDYKAALPIMLPEAQAGNKAAQYRVAEMYEKGLGTEINYKKASYWYKQSAGYFSYAESDAIKQDDTLAEELFGDDSIKRGNEYVLAKLDTHTPEAKKAVNGAFGGGFFGLSPYKDTFFLPVSYASSKPTRVSSVFPSNTIIPAEFDNVTKYDKNTETEFQISLKKQISYNLFGMNEFIWFGYTQHVWWQMYADSAPFRETNYMPEVFMSVPTSQSIDDAVGLKAVRFGFIHQSNGQEGYRSRSWNRVYATGLWQWGNLFLSTRAWYKLSEDSKGDAYYAGALGPLGANKEGDDNPDIASYLGYGDIKVNYLYGKNQFGALWRNNLRFNGDNRGAIELKWSYPFFDSPNIFWYAKFFNGYGESLIDYNKNVTKTSVGFSFTRSLFD